MFCGTITPVVGTDADIESSSLLHQSQFHPKRLHHTTPISVKKNENVGFPHRFAAFRGNDGSGRTTRLSIK